MRDEQFHELHFSLKYLLDGGSDTRRVKHRLITLFIHRPSCVTVFHIFSVVAVTLLLPVWWSTMESLWDQMVENKTRCVNPWNRTHFKHCKFVWDIDIICSFNINTHPASDWFPPSALMTLKWSLYRVNTLTFTPYLFAPPSSFIGSHLYVVMWVCVFVCGLS